ncbi:MAG: HdeD family acid-resistance protein [Clostridiales bacterium]|nr:HdeD family acid-resistance protein [Clostridiales bacterium]
MRILTIISGIMMLLTGAFCFINPGQTFLSLAFIIGIVLVFNGIVHTGAYLVGRGFHNRGDNNGWILTDALITLLLGILVLCNQLVAEAAVHAVFGMWVLVSGILRIESATHINREKKRTNFRIVLITGIMTIVVGVFGFVDPLVGMVSTVILVGMFMFMQGINIMELGINMPHEKKSYIRLYKRKREPVKITEDEETPEKVAERLRAKEEAEATALAGVKINETL